MRAQSRQTLRTLLIGLVAIALLVGIYAFSSTFRGLVHGSGGEPVAASDRRTLPDMVWKDLDGKEWKLAEQRGNVVVLNYFATWCAPCRREMPDLAVLVKEYQPRGVAFAAISVDTEEEMGKPLAPALKEFADDNRIAVPVLLAHPAASPVHLRGVPTTVLIDRHGRIAQVFEGQFPIGGMRTTLDKLLAEK